MIRILSLSCALLLLTVNNAAAQSNFKKGTWVTVTVPATLLKNEGVLLASSAPIYAANVSVNGTSVSVNGDADWPLAGFPLMLHAHFEKMSQKKEFTEIEVRAELPQASGVGAIKFRFQPGLTADALSDAFAQLAIPGLPTSDAARAYRQIAYRKLATKFFTGPLATIPPATQLALVEFAHVTANGTTLSSDVFKGNTYLAINVGSGDSIYNEIRMNQAARMAAVLNDRLLLALKAFGALVGEAPQVYGLKLSFSVPHKNFLRDTGPTTYDDVQLYAPSELIKKFQDADITNQQFIDGCVVIADANRVQVNLASTGGL